MNNLGDRIRKDTDPSDHFNQRENYMTTVSYEEVFTDMRMRLSSPTQWIKGSAAMTSKNGLTVCSLDERATCFCLRGLAQVSVANVKNSPCVSKVWDAMDDMVFFVYPRYSAEESHASDFNDDRKTTHKEVLEFLDIAVLNCRLAGV